MVAIRHFIHPYMENIIMVQLHTSVNDRLCVGIDLHRDTMTVACLDPRTGEVTFRKLACKCRTQITEYFTNLPRPHSVAIEAVGFYRWLWDLLEPIVDALHLADATRCRALAATRPKTDRQDALNVADLMAAGRLPIAYAPPMHVRQLRDWTRHRNGLARSHARVLTRVQSIMNANNRPGPKRAKADALIRYVKAHGSLLPQRHVRMLWLAVDQLTLIERQIDDAQRVIVALLADEKFAAVDALLRSIPGVGPVTSATAIAELGDLTRFTDRKQITRYAGLNPRTFDSADKQRTGRITKAGPRQLRWVLQQAAWCARRDHPIFRKRFGQLSKRVGKAKAGVALARKLLLCMWAVVRDGKPYRPVGDAS
jgi:transposase